MGRRRVLFCSIVLWIALCGGCSSPSGPVEKERHAGAKINIGDFIANSAAYKGKIISLTLKVDEPGVKNRGQSLREYAGRDAKFTTTGPKGERLNLVITLPKDVSVPEGSSDEFLVRFVCTRGNLRQGNEARSIESP